MINDIVQDLDSHQKVTNTLTLEKFPAGGATGKVIVTMLPAKEASNPVDDENTPVGVATLFWPENQLTTLPS